jgi:uncharacterized protein
LAAARTDLPRTTDRPKVGRVDEILDRPSNRDRGSDHDHETMTTNGHAQVAKICRYPVKSMRGEELAEVSVHRRGLDGDRCYALRTSDGRLGSGKTSRRFRRIDRLIDFQASYAGPALRITCPNGTTIGADDPRVDAHLSSQLGHQVTLVTDHDTGHFDDGPVHLLTTATLASVRELAPDSVVDHRRFRPNLLIDWPRPGLVEHGWIGRTLRLGREVELAIVMPMTRCAMVGMAQDDLASDPRILRALAAHSDMFLGVVAEVRTPGRVALGDEVHLG